MSGPDGLTEHSVHTWNVAANGPVGIPTIVGRSVDLFSKRKSLLFLFLILTRLACGARITALTVND